MWLQQTSTPQKQKSVKEPTLRQGHVTRSIAGARCMWRNEVLGIPVSIGVGPTHNTYTDTSIVESSTGTFKGDFLRLGDKLNALPTEPRHPR